MQLCAQVTLMWRNDAYSVKSTVISESRILFFIVPYYFVFLGWEGVTDGDLNKITSGKGSMCDVPICDEGHCGAKGVCVEPNVCTCPELTSRVSLNYKTRKFPRGGCNIQKDADLS